MIDNTILSSVFDNYNINNVFLIKDNTTYNFIISNMPASISLERWEYLENILKDITKANVNLITLTDALKHFGKENLSKGEVIKWKTDIKF